METIVVGPDPVEYGFFSKSGSDSGDFGPDLDPNILMTLDTLKNIYFFTTLTFQLTTTKNSTFCHYFLKKWGFATIFQI
jgi:hypothetical protein